MFRTQLLVASAVSILATTAFAQDVDWRAEIGAEMVQIQDGKMVYEDFEICRVEGSDLRMQVRYYAEAPVDAGISRDFFISQTVASDALILYGFLAEASGLSFSAFLNVFDCDPLSAPIGTVDLELNLFMTADGFQFEFVDTAAGDRERSAATWSETYND